MANSSQLGYLQLGVANLGGAGGFEGAGGDPWNQSFSDTLTLSDVLVTGLGITRVVVADSFSLVDATSTGLAVARLIVTDTLTLSDAFTYRSNLILLLADSLNNWSDVLTYNYLAPSTPLSVVVVDKFVRSGGVNGNNYSLRDGLSWVRGPSGPVNISLSDLGAFLDDSLLQIGYGIRVED